MKIKYSPLLLFLIIAPISAFADKNTLMYYYDGKKKLEVYMNTDQFIDFSRNDDVAASLQNEAVLVNSMSNGFRIWKRNESASMQKIRSIASTNRLSETFSYDSKGGSSMGLPGGVIVRFNKDWNEAKILNWLSQKGFRGKGLIASLNIWFINSDAGVRSIRLANELYEAGEVESSLPNWWRNHITK